MFKPNRLGTNHKDNPIIKGQKYSVGRGNGSNQPKTNNAAQKVHYKSLYYGKIRSITLTEKLPTHLKEPSYKKLTDAEFQNRKEKGICFISDVKRSIRSDTNVKAKNRELC